MKRHNLLLLTYIIFTIICLVVRSFTEFVTWNYVVSAVAIASALLAYADLFYIHSKYYSDSGDMDEQFVAERCKKIEKEKKIAEDVCIKISELKSNGFDVVKYEKSFKIENHWRSEAEKILSEIKARANLKHKKHKKYLIIADVLTLLAFLSFLCLITFTNIADIFGKAQDIISIIAFAVVLSSQYMNSVFSEKQSKEQERYDYAVKEHDAAHDQLFEVRNDFNIYYEKVKDYAD